MEHIYDFPVEYSRDNDIKSFYEQNGYVSIKNGISGGDIKEIVDDLTQIFSPFATDPEQPIDSAIIDLDKRDKPKLYELHQIA